MKKLTKKNLNGFFDSLKEGEEFTYSQKQFNLLEVMDVAIENKYKVVKDSVDGNMKFIGKLSDKEDYYFNTHKKLIKECGGKIVDFAKKEVKNLFAYETCEVDIRIDSNERVGFFSFELFMIDENGDSKFGCSVEVKLNSNNQKFTIPRLVDSEIDYSLQSVRISSNPRNVGNKFETSQTLIAALLISHSDSLSVLFKTVGESLFNSHKILESL